MATNIRRYFEKDQPINQQNPLVLADYQLNTSLSSLELCGLYFEGYATPITESIIWLTENFAGPTPPANALKGQCWYNTTSKLLYIYDGLDSRDGGDSTQTTFWVKPVDVNAEDLAAHIANVNNPHQVTRNQIGLGNVADVLQLAASANLADLTDKTQARTNLDVYDTAYINANFAGIGSTVSNTLSLNGLSSGQFLRSDIDTTAAGRISFTATDGLRFTRLTGVPIAIDDGDIKFTVHDNSGNFNIKAGTNINGGTDSYRTTGDGAVKVSWEYEGKDAGFTVGVAPIGTIGNAIDYSNSTFSVKKDGAYWNSNKLVTDAGFTTHGNIVPSSGGNYELGSTASSFLNVYSTNFVGKSSDSALLNGSVESNTSSNNTIVKRDSTGGIRAQRYYADDTTINDVGLTSTSQAAYRDLATGLLEYASQAAFQNWIGVSDATAGSSFSTSGNNGYMILPPWLGSFIIQWGKITGVAPNTTTTYTMPRPFTTIYSAVGNWGSGSGGCGYTFRWGTPTNTNLNWAWDVPSNVGAGVLGVVQWIAIGK